ncbi:MAG: hypothetical protein RL329_1792 [Bacteroidota bacterium]
MAGILSIEQLFFTIEQIIRADDKITDLKIIIENKKIEITNISNKNKIKELNAEIKQVTEDLQNEKRNYQDLKQRYDKLETKYLSWCQ